MSKVSVNELTEEQIKRIEDIKKRDLVSGFIVDGMIHKSEVDFDIIHAIEQRSLSQDYYVASEVLFNAGASVEWINIVLNTVTTVGDHDEIINFIREVVYAYNSHVNVEDVGQYIVACDSPAELHAFIDDIVHTQESNTKVIDTIQKIPELIGKIEADNNEAKQNFESIKKELESKIAEVDRLNDQIDELQKKNQTDISEKDFEKIKKKANFYEKKFRESQNELRSCSDRCARLETELFDAYQKIEKTKELASATVNDESTADLKKFIDDSLKENISSISKTVAASYSQVLNAVNKDKEEASNNSDVDALNKILSMNENIMEQLKSINVASGPNVQKSLNEEFTDKKEKPQPHEEGQPHDIPTNEEHGIFNDFSEPEYDEGDVLGELPETAQEDDDMGQADENYKFEEPEPPTDEQIISKEDGNNYSDDVKQAKTVSDSEPVKKSPEPDISICKAPELTESKVLKSKKHDSKVEQKIGFFARMRFNHISSKKQRQLILDLMLHKKLPMTTIKNVKSLLDTNKLDNAFVFELINDENVNDDVIHKALEFVK